MEEWKWHNCKVCGRDYQKPKGQCPFCRKQKLWDGKTIEEKAPMLSPRLKQELEKHKSYPFPTRPAESMYLTGPAGSGKTVFAAKVLLDLLEDMFVEGIYIRPQFVTINKLTDEIKQAYAKKEPDLPIIEKYKECDWLILDDIGTKATTDWVYDILFSIIDYRYEQLKKTIIISNMSFEDMSAYLNDERITRRIAAMSQVYYHFEK
jgi:DNA replication protein DnaC